MARIERRAEPGAGLVRAVQAGQRSCASLTGQNFELIGEYAMGQALGATKTHAAMNARMTQMMGNQGQQRMHQLIGQRYAGCRRAQGAAKSATGGSMMGQGIGMMSGGAGPMMATNGWWSAMRNWRHMNPSGWQRAMGQLGGSSAATSGSGLSAVDITLLILAIGLGAGVVLLLALRRPWLQKPA